MRGGVEQGHTVDVVVVRSPILLALEVAIPWSLTTRKRSSHTIRIASTGLRTLLQAACILAAQIAPVEISAACQGESFQSIGE